MTQPYEGTDYQNQPLRDAWWTPGWTSQNESYIAVPANQLKEQGFPSGLTYVTVTGNYFDLDGNFTSGYLTFWPSAPLVISDGTVTASFAQRFVGLNNTFIGMNTFGNGRIYLWNGNLSVTLLATDQPGTGITMTPPSFTYHVKEHFFEGDEYEITVPSSYASTGVDIHNLIVGYGTQE